MSQSVIMEHFEKIVLTCKCEEVFPLIGMKIVTVKSPPDGLNYHLNGDNNSVTGSIEHVFKVMNIIRETGCKPIGLKHTCSIRESRVSGENHENIRGCEDFEKFWEDQRG